MYNIQRLSHPKHTYYQSLSNTKLKIKKQKIKKNKK
jgi:hypothetical protein